MDEHHPTEPHTHGPLLRGASDGHDDALDGVVHRSSARIPIELDDPEVRRRRAAIAPSDWARFEASVAEMLAAFGLKVDQPGTRDTPRRFVRALFDSTEGYDGDPKLVTVFPTECYGGSSCELSQVVEGPIPFTSPCEHHALPFVGRAFVGHIRPREHHRHQQADAAGTDRHAAVRRPGADDSPDRRSADGAVRSRTASPSIWTPTTCALRCAACANSTP
jgi:hypothetical protein